MLGTSIVEKLSRCLEFSARKDGASKVAADSDSDSGSSLFLTQHCVPDHVRSRRQMSSSRRAAGSRDVSSLFTSPSKRSLDGSRKSLRFKLPKYSFTLPKEKPTCLTLKTRQNIRLHYAGMGGFFNCVQNLRAGYQTAPLPTVDLEGETIAPIAEGEETSEDGHIRIVEKKHLVVLSKTKRTQPWYDPPRRSSSVKPQCDKRPETSHQGHHEAPHSSFTQRDSSGNALDKTPRHKKAFLVQSRASNARKKIVFEQEETEEQFVSDSDATIDELPVDYAQSMSEELTNRVECLSDLSLRNKLSQSQEECESESQSLCENVEGNKNSERRRSHSMSREEEIFQSQKPPVEKLNSKSVIVSETPNQPPTMDELDSLSHGDAQDNGDVLHSKSKKKKKKKKKRHKDVMSEEEETSQCTDELLSGKAVSVDETPELPIDNHKAQENGDKSIQKLKKKKKSKLLEDDIVQEMEGQVESEEKISVLSSCCAEEGRIKKKKRNRKGEDAAEPHEKIKELNVTLDQTSTENINECGGSLETCEATVGISESSKKKKKKKKRHSVCDDDPGADVTSSYDVISPEESQELPVKKKKMKSVIHGEEEEGNPQITLEGAAEQDNEVLPKKKKKKKAFKEASLSIISSDAVMQSDDSVSVCEKEQQRTSSFLAADAESKSAGIGGSLVEQKEGRKKKKRKASECAADADKSRTHDASMEEETPSSLEKQGDEMGKKNRKKKKKKIQGVLPEDEFSSEPPNKDSEEKVVGDSSDFLLPNKIKSGKKAKRSLYSSNGNFLSE